MVSQLTGPGRKLSTPDPLVSFRKDSSGTTQRAVKHPFTLWVCRFRDHGYSTVQYTANITSDAVTSDHLDEAFLSRHCPVLFNVRVADLPFRV